MPNLYPGIKPLFHGGRRFLCLVPFAFLSTIILGFLPTFIMAQPTISSVAPLTGSVGTSVTISGNNFNPTPSANIVCFGSVRAQVTAAGPNTLTVTVPPGNSYQPVTVNSGGLTAFSYSPFITTFLDTGQFNTRAFSTRTDYSTGNGPQSIFSMDLDGDGKPDLMTADGDSNTVEFYHNNSTQGSISFALQVDDTLPAGNYPIAITAGDLDGDGRPEVIVTNFGSNLLFVFHNTSTPGTISFASPITYATGNYSLSATIGDCNADGKPDIIVASAVDNIVSIFPNSSTPGNLSFSARQDLTVSSGGFPVSVIVADLDGDGMPDLACANAMTSSVSVFRNTGTPGGPPSFAANVDFTVGNTPNQVVVGDMDGDGKPDMATANNGDNTISLLRNTGTTGTISFSHPPDVPGSNGAWSLVLGDFDGDGKPDLASVNNLANSISVYRNISTAGTVSIAANADYPVGDYPYFVTTADYDGDGMPDIATINNTVATVSVLLNTNSSVPAITSFTPRAGNAGTVVTITGVNLGGATQVSFGGVNAGAFTVVSADTITATVGFGGSGIVSVITPSGTASLGGFLYGVPQPVINSFSPDSGTTGTTVLIYGTNLSGVSTVTFGGVAANFSVLSDSVISAIVGPGASGNVAVTAPGGPATMPGFTFIAPPPPPFAFTSFSPTSGTTGTTVLIRGSGLLNTSSVTFGGVSASNITVTSDTMILATVGTGATGAVVITNSSNVIDSLPGFTYTTPPPPPPPANIILSSFTPATGLPGTSVTIKGSDLKSATGVSFGGTPALAFTIQSDSVIIAIVGTGASGMVKVANPTSIDSLNGFVFETDTAKQSSGQAFQLLNFAGAMNSGLPQLKWTVQDDAGISYYAVERSKDSLQYFIIGTVTSLRSNGASHTYSLADQNPGKGINYYRLRMQDTTVSYTYSYTISIQLASLPVHPNPVKYGFFYVDLPTTDSPSEFQLSDLSGKVLQSISEPPGISRVEINVPGLPNGTYLLSWTNGKRSGRQTILVLSP
jgi:hypothetical protein